MNAAEELARVQVLDRHRLVRQRAAELSERDLGFYFRQAWKVLEPTTPLLPNWHQDYLGEHLEAVAAGEITRLIINIPPRYAKSNFVSVAFPTWTWVGDPAKRFMCFSYALPLATKHSVDRRSLIESPWYQGPWGNRFSLAADSNMKTAFSNDHRGQMLAGSVRGGSLGQGADIIIVDDPHSVRSADSDLVRDSDCQAFDRGIRTRLNAKTGAIIIVMQRLHEKDLTGHVLAQEPGVWTHVRIPAEEKKRTVYVYPRSGATKTREVGDILHPERHSREDLAATRKGMGSYGYAGQYDQDPSPAAGGIFKRTWMMKRWRKLPDRWTRRLISVDCAFKGEEAIDKPDFVCFQLWGQAGSGQEANFYLIDQVHDIMDFVGTVKGLADFLGKHKGIYEVCVEDKANGPAVISTLKNKYAGLVAIEPNGSKVSRARAVSPLFEAGNVWLPAEGEWISGYVEEMAAFPKAANDDRVDATTQALLRFQGNASGEFTEQALANRKTIAAARGSQERW